MESIFENLRHADAGCFGRQQGELIGAGVGDIPRNVAVPFNHSNSGPSRIFFGDIDGSCQRLPTHLQV